VKKLILKNATIINEGLQYVSDLLIENDRIARIDKNISTNADRIIDAEGLYLMPGIIDDQVHFRQPGLEYKADIASESRAGIAGGVTSYMDMPNNNPPILTQSALENKYAIAKKYSYSNYSFYMGASNDNLEEVLKTDFSKNCGIKVFMGSSTGNMLVDNQKTLEGIFSRCLGLIATHCEDEATIRENLKYYKDKFGDKLDATYHPLIRNHEACFKSSSLAIELAKRYNSRLHVLHLTTAEELKMLSADTDVSKKRITGEVCVHHLYFNDEHYRELGNKIKCNPAIKTENDRQNLFKAMLENRIDVIATDHAPHTLEEKSQGYFNSPSGLPLVQHSLQLMLDFYQKNEISLEKIVEKMCHNPALVFKIKDRGFIREGYFADIVLVDLNKKYIVERYNLLYKCKWSPLEGKVFNSEINTVIVNGTIVFEDKKLTENSNPMRLEFYDFPSNNIEN
jgi:dihydroorotase